jgi:hypothetical protein
MCNHFSITALANALGHTVAEMGSIRAGAELPSSERARLRAAGDSRHN